MTFSAVISIFNHDYSSFIVLVAIGDGNIAVYLSDQIHHVGVR